MMTKEQLHKELAKYSGVPEDEESLDFILEIARMLEKTSTAPGYYVTSTAPGYYVAALFIYNMVAECIDKEATDTTQAAENEFMMLGDEFLTIVERATKQMALYAYNQEFQANVGIIAKSMGMKTEDSLILELATLIYTLIMMARDAENGITANTLTIMPLEGDFKRIMERAFKLFELNHKDAKVIAGIKQFAKMVDATEVDTKMLAIVGTAYSLVGILVGIVAEAERKRKL